LALVRHYDVIYLEDVQVRNMSRRPAPHPDGNRGYAHNGASRKAGLNTSIHDAGWYAFRVILACKAAWAGKRVEAISPAFTTQDCSGCGERVQKSLSTRTHVCTHCGLILDRDENAATNIQWTGRALRGLAGMPAGTSREAPCLSAWGACHVERST
jgi:putative transposase